MNSTIFILVLKLVAQGIVSFFAILLMSRLREIAWTFIVAGFLFSYINLVYELLVEIGVFTISSVMIFSIPLPFFILNIIPMICFLIGFIIFLAKK